MNGLTLDQAFDLILDNDGAVRLPAGEAQLRAVMEREQTLPGRLFVCKVVGQQRGEVLAALVENGVLPALERWVQQGAAEGKLDLISAALDVLSVRGESKGRARVFSRGRKRWLKLVRGTGGRAWLRSRRLKLRPP